MQVSQVDCQLLASTILLAKAKKFLLSSSKTKTMHIAEDLADQLRNMSADIGSLKEAKDKIQTQVDNIEVCSVAFHARTDNRNPVLTISVLSLSKHPFFSPVQKQLKDKAGKDELNTLRKSTPGVFRMSTKPRI